MDENFLQFTENFFGKIENFNIEKSRILNRSRKTERFDPVDNYETLELYGDKILQEQFCRYLMEEYNIIYYVNAANIITRLIIKFLSGECLSAICNNIGLSKFILDEGNINKYGVEEDIFEAWIGACKLLYTQQQFEAGLNRIFNSLKISFGYQDLYDPRSILNDFSSAIHTKMVNKGTKLAGEEFINKTAICGADLPIMVGIGYAKTKKLAEQESARKILDNYISLYGAEKFFEQLKKTKNYRKWKLFFLSYKKVDKKLFEQ